MRRFRAGLVCLALLGTTCTLPAQSSTKELGPGERYAWTIRATHADAILIAVGDSVDIVLLRDRCGVPIWDRRRACVDANTVRATPRWLIGAREVAHVRPLESGSWIFGQGAAGARIVAVRPGRTFVTATLPTGETASDSIWVVSAPGAVRIVLEPKPRVIMAGDTVRFRVTARDSADRIVATLTLPRSWKVVGPPDSLGFTPVKFPAWETGGRLVPRLGRLTDTLNFQVVVHRWP